MKNQPKIKVRGGSPVKLAGWRDIPATWLDEIQEMRLALLMPQQNCTSQPEQQPLELRTSREVFQFRADTLDGPKPIPSLAALKRRLLAIMKQNPESGE